MRTLILTTMVFGGVYFADAEYFDKYFEVKRAFNFLETLEVPKAIPFPSESLVSFIKEKESFRAQSYVCKGGAVTIGYGFTSCDIEEGIKRGYLEEGYSFPKVMSTSEADFFLRNVAIPIYNEMVTEMVDVPLSQNQREALISFVYNVGPKNFEKIACQLNSGDYNIGERMKRYCFAKGKRLDGLVVRRNEEVVMFNNN